MLGMEIFVAANRRQSRASLEEGKKAMGFEAYKR